MEQVCSEKVIKAVGAAVLTRRIQRNVSQEDLCKAAAVNKSLLARVEAGLLDIELTTLRRFAVALDTTVSSLLETAENEL
ncbi:MAG TPA: helix-turn-helix transcriptional regulator [Planktothrix sp.]|jgi:transcriptional regulator with XRE-family HTH domain